MSFSAYIIMLGGIAALMVLIELILPESSTGKYIRSIAAIFVVFAIISPIPSMLKNAKLNIGSAGSVILDEAFLIKVGEEKCKVMEEDIKTACLQKDIDANATLSIVLTEGEVKIVYASVVVNSFSGDKGDAETIIKNIVKKYVVLDDNNISIMFSGVK